VRSIRDERGTELLPKVLASPEIIQKCYRHGLFPTDFIQKLGLLPTEYLYFYYFPQAAYQNTKQSGQSRGQAIEAMNIRLAQRLAQAPDSQLIEIYENYLRERNASYFSIEATAGERRRENQELYSEFSGYEKIALLVLQALHADNALADSAYGSQRQQLLRTLLRMMRSSSRARSLRTALQCLRWAMRRKLCGLYCCR
jgi:hypothetical protein